MDISQLLAGIVLVGSAVGVIAKWIAPAIKLQKRVETLEYKIDKLEHKDTRRITDIVKNEKANRLLCRAMVALIDNQITGNSTDDLKAQKKELMKFLTEIQDS